MLRAAHKAALVRLLLALLFCLRFSCSAQSFAERPQALVTKDNAYLLGPIVMIAPAQIEDITVNPRGRYALVFQKEAALPSGAPSNKPLTGAVTLLLYDAKLRKTRPLWERPADGNEYSIADAKWIPGTDCAVVVTIDTLPSDGKEAAKGISGLLLFNFAKSNAARVLATTTTSFFDVAVSPVKPVFVVHNWKGGQAQLVNALTGTLGPVLPGDAYSKMRFPAWSEDGNTMYGVGTLPSKDSSNKFPDLQWFAWDGKSPDVKVLASRPTRSLGTFFDSNSSPPKLPVVLRVGALLVPPADAPTTKLSAEAKQKNAPVALHPLFLEAATDAAPASGANCSVLVAPDADKSYLLADQSAILYQSGSALYAVPLVRVKADAYAARQKSAQIVP